MLLIGFYLGEGKPEMNTYLNILVENANKFYLEGFLVTNPQDQPMVARGLLQCESADLGAHAAAAQMDNRAGYYGCPVCEHKGTLICGKTALTEPVEQEPVEEKEVEQEEDVIEIEMGNIEELQVEESQTQNQARNEGGKGKKRTPKKTMYFPPLKAPCPIANPGKDGTICGQRPGKQKKRKWEFMDLQFWP